MGRKRTPGLYRRGESWHVDKQVFGQRICESTCTNSLEEAEKYLARRIESLRQVAVYGARPKRKFREAATKFLAENQHKKSIQSDAEQLGMLDKHIGDLPIEAVHIGTLQPFIEARKKDGRKNRTINFSLQIVRHILNLAASEWMDDNSLTWLNSSPKIKLLPINDARKPYPLNWDEQERLFNMLPSHLRRMALFAVNTGCRDQEICSLRWEWEVKVPELNTSVFIIPGAAVKNGEDRLVVLNKVALSVVNEVRGQHSEKVFTYNGRPLTRMLNSAWKRARKRVGLVVRVHDLKHTFGRRLRAAGVSFEDRQDLLGHKSGRITTHYSAAEIVNLLDAANKVCEARQDANSPTLTLLRSTSAGLIPAQVNAG
ncbi:MAG TPA: integrase [Coxiellaceae bacterium]|nr:integrase [Coxiellaceae bacterium]HBY55559.1 integrase [Coxiellaceae bacterium]